jgi:hypothetical protein
MSTDLPTAHYVTALRDLIHVFADDDRMSATQESFAEQARETLHYAAERLNGSASIHDAWLAAMPETRCECMASGPHYSNAGNPNHDGSPDECPDCYQGVRPMTFAEWCTKLVNLWTAATDPGSALHNVIVNLALDQYISDRQGEQR